MRSFKLALGFVLTASAAAAQSYPSPIFNNITSYGSFSSTQTLSGSFSASQYSNPITLNYGAFSNPGHDNYGWGTKCNVNSTSYKGQLLCNYSVMTISDFYPDTSISTPDNSFVGNFNLAYGYANTTAGNAGLFGGNDNVAVTGTGWKYIVGREIDVTVTSSATSIANKIGLSIVQAGNDAIQGTTTDAMIYGINAPGAVGWKNAIYLDAVNNRVISATGCILCLGASQTIAKGIDLTGWTFSGNTFASTGFAVSGAGKITAGSVIINDGIGAQFSGSSAVYTPIYFTDTNTSGNNWAFGPGVGTGSASSLNIYNYTTTTTVFQISNAGKLTVPTLNLSAAPTSAGSGGLYLCIDTSGNTYKKASCP